MHVSNPNSNPKTNPMANANGFKLGLFSINAAGGTAFTKVPNRWRAQAMSRSRRISPSPRTG